MKLTVCIVAAVLGAAWAPAPAAGPSTELGTRHVDKINGFSLRPPAGAVRRREYSPSRLVSWTRRDKATGAIDMTMVVLKATSATKKITLKTYAAQLKTKLAREQQWYIDRALVTTVGGKGAIDLSGVGGVSGLGVWQRQVWILVGEGQFLILAVSGPRGSNADKGRNVPLDALYTKVLSSVELIDPAGALRQRKANLQRGQDLLAGLTDATLKAAFDAELRWYLFRKDDKDVGYMAIKAAPARRDGSAGYEVTSTLRLKLPADQVRHAKREQFATTNRIFCRWRETMVVGVGPNSGRYVEEGVKQSDVILCRLFANGQVSENQKRLTRPAGKMFLPRAFGMVLPRLLDLKKPNVYAFATYASQPNALDMRTVTVDGAESITLDARRTQAVRISDRAAADGEPATVWVDAKGAILRMSTPDGLVMDASTRGAIIRRFPAEEVTIRMIK